MMMTSPRRKLCLQSLGSVKGQVDPPLIKPFPVRSADTEGSHSFPFSATHVERFPILHLTTSVKLAFQPRPPQRTQQSLVDRRNQTAVRLWSDAGRTRPWNFTFLTCRQTNEPLGREGRRDVRGRRHLPAALDVRHHGVINLDKKGRRGQLSLGANPEPTVGTCRTLVPAFQGICDGKGLTSIQHLGLPAFVPHTRKVSFTFCMTVMKLSHCWKKRNTDWD